jgi:hypothetical protein
VTHGGARGGLALAPTGGGQLGWRGNDRQRPGRGARVRTVAGDAGSLMSGARLAARGRRGERRGARLGRPGKEMEWAKPGENAKWAGPG